MTTRLRYYAAHRPWAGAGTDFRAPQYDVVATRETQPVFEQRMRDQGYSHVIGPHRTKRAAEFMASPAAHNNPHCQCVAGAERISKTL